jgi:iron complex outermembrane receptor protein
MILKRSRVLIVIYFLTSVSFSKETENWSNASDKTNLSQNSTQQYAIQKGRLGASLVEFSKTSGFNFIYGDKRIKEAFNAAVLGRFTAKNALIILLRNTGYSYEFVARSTVRIFEQKSSKRTSISQQKKWQAGKRLMTEVISLGTRSKNRKSVFESPVPIDIFEKGLLESQSFGSLADTLQTIIPSLIIFPFPSSDGSALIRPPTFRGLPQDQILVLVNGKRRHRSALVNLIGTGLDPMSQGSQGVDFSIIPKIALRRVELLRDGASAQYGSDAISGVLNLILKDGDRGLELNSQYGQYYVGDGQDFQIAGNVGLPLGENGFLNLSAEYISNDPTSRGEQRTDVQELIDMGLDVADPAQIWGSPKLRSVRTFWNGSLDVLEESKFYFFGNYAASKGRATFFFRHPLTSTVFAKSIYDPNFDLKKRYPAGFTPNFDVDVTDYSQIIGLKGELTEGLFYDVSGQYGHNTIEYTVSNTVNPSLGNSSPSSFKSGNLLQEEYGINIDFSFPFKVEFLENLVNMAFGIEYRNEEYTIEAGEEASYIEGPLKDLAIGANGFPGYSPSQAGKYGRNSYSAYIDLESKISDQFLINLASRYENYSDFESRLDSKIALRYEFSPSSTLGAFALRASISTGFRAPTAGQSYTLNTSTYFESGNPNPLTAATYPADHAVSLFYGSKEVISEKSSTFTMGMMWQPASPFSFSLDFYVIKVRDRIGISKNLIVKDEDRDALKSLGVHDARTIYAIRFFNNSFNTQTYGVDFVGIYETKFKQGDLSFSLEVNYNKQKLNNFDSNIIDVERVIELQEGYPDMRGVFTINYKAEEFHLLVRSSYYDDFIDASPSGGILTKIGAEILVDIEASYHLNEHVKFMVGARNIFDNYPDKTDQYITSGLPYSFQSPFGFNGGFWYARVALNF